MGQKFEHLSPSDFCCNSGPGNQQGRCLVDSFHGSRVRNDGEAEGRDIVHELHRKGLVGENFEQAINIWYCFRLC